MLLSDRITQAISFAERYSKQLAVMFVDLDYFKKINDAFGHAVGDKLLQSVATRLVACVRRSDTVSRLSGDEFAVLLSQVEHAEDAVFSAHKIMKSLAAPYFIDQKHLDISEHWGQYLPWRWAGRGYADSKADTAMYDAKKLGRNGYQFFKAEMQTRVLERQSLEGSLRRALDRNELTLAYQPKVDLKPGGHWCGSVVALEPPRAGARSTVRIHPHCRRNGVDSSYWSVGASRSVSADSRLDECGPRAHTNGG